MSLRVTTTWLSLCLIAAAGAARGQEAPAIPTFDELEARGARIGSITLQVDDVFDTSTPKENKSIFRLANRLHINTRDSVIKSQLLFHSGDRFRKSIIEESERLLRRNQFFYDAMIRVVRYEDNIADIVVSARDSLAICSSISS